MEEINRPLWFTMLYNASEEEDQSGEYQFYVKVLAALVKAKFVNFVHNYLRLPAMVEYGKDKDLYFISSYQEFFTKFDPKSADYLRSDHVDQLASLSKFFVVTRPEQLSAGLFSVPIIPRQIAERIVAETKYVDGDNCFLYEEGDADSLVQKLIEARSYSKGEVLRMRKAVVETVLVEKELQSRSDAVREVVEERTKKFEPATLVGPDGLPL